MKLVRTLEKEFLELSTGIIARTLDEEALASSTRKTRKSKVTLEDSVAAVEFVLDIVLHAVVNGRSSTGIKGRREPNIQHDSSMVHDTIGGEEKEVLYEFPRSLYNYTTKGQCYCVYYCQLAVNERRNH